jgi:hypothetical protein
MSGLPRKSHTRGVTIRIVRITALGHRGPVGANRKQINEAESIATALDSSSHRLACARRTLESIRIGSGERRSAAYQRRDRIFFMVVQPRRLAMRLLGLGESAGQVIWLVASGLPSRSTDRQYRLQQSSSPTQSRRLLPFSGCCMSSLQRLLCPIAPKGLSIGAAKR